MKNSLLRLLRIKLNYNENVAKQRHKYKIVNENGDKQSQSTHVEINIFARQKSNALSRIWIVQNNLHIAET